MNILITGGAGYIGSLLATELLKYDNNVTLVDNLMHDQGILVNHIFQHKNCKFLKCDVMEIPQKEIDKADVIFPLAALVGAPLCLSQPTEAGRVNRDAIKWLMEKTNNNHRIIFPNTNSGYGETGEEACTEETPLKSISVYGSTKEAAETIVIEHPGATVFRLATLHGLSPRPRLDLMVNFFLYLAYYSKHIDVYEGNFRRNFVHIQDVVNIFIQSIHRSETCGQIYNLGRDEDNMTKQELIDYIKKEIGFEITTGTLNIEDPDKRDYLVSNKKLYDAGLVPQYSIKDTIKEMTRFFANIPNKEHIIRLMKNI